MNRKVIQITNDNIALCDDGTMWKFKIMETTSAESEGYEYSTDWTQLDGVPQDNEIYNDPGRLAPLGVPIVVLVDGEEIEVIRTKPIDEHGFMEYKLNDGQLMTGRFMWRYV